MDIGTKNEWLNRIAFTWNNRAHLRQARSVLDRYSTATEAVAHHPEMVTSEAMAHAQKELDFIEKHHIVPYYYTIFCGKVKCMSTIYGIKKSYR